MLCKGKHSQEHAINDALLDSADRTLNSTNIMIDITFGDVSGKCHIPNDLSVLEPNHQSKESELLSLQVAALQDLFMLACVD